jgi:hypothetical protein
MIGIQKTNRQLITVTAAKQTAKLHAVMRIEASATFGRPPSCHATMAANR